MKYGLILHSHCDDHVAPLVGAWIEIYNRTCGYARKRSLLLWERGLKFPMSGCSRGRNLVAPLVGAWIEIFPMILDNRMGSVAPLVGAWIEIRCSCLQMTTMHTSLLLWERGLKSRCLRNRYVRVKSLLLWERGLKSPESGNVQIVIPSLLLWERGLKSNSSRKSWREMEVAPLVGAWIEIQDQTVRGSPLSGRSSCGSVD